MALPWQRAFIFGQNMAFNEAYWIYNEPGDLRDLTIYTHILQFYVVQLQINIDMVLFL